MSASGPFAPRLLETNLNRINLLHLLFLGPKLSVFQGPQESVADVTDVQMFDVQIYEVEAA